MRKLTFLILVLATLACSHSEKMAESSSYDSEPISVDSKRNITQDSKELSALPEVKIERKIIKSGDIKFSTKDPIETKNRIEKITSSLGGYVSKDEINTYNNSQESLMEIRIPAEHFDELLLKINEGAYKIDSKQISALDVTESYVDVINRIKTKKEVLARYKEILKQARTIDEIMSVENQIGNLQTDIESYEGRLRYMSDRIDMSTLTLRFYKPGDSHIYKNNFWADVLEAIEDGWDGFKIFMIALITIWPIPLILLCILFITRSIIKKKKNQDK